VGRKHELARLEELLTTVRGGGSAALVVQGEPGVGKSALLDQISTSAEGFKVVRAIGVEGEVDLPYAALHQICRSMTEPVSALPQPQSDALRVAFGESVGDAHPSTKPCMSFVGAPEPSARAIRREPRL
jgi:Cdc6-like AAA superfamily ATPase